VVGAGVGVVIGVAVEIVFFVACCDIGAIHALHVGFYSIHRVHEGVLCYSSNRSCNTVVEKGAGTIPLLPVKIVVFRHSIKGGDYYWWGLWMC